MTETKKEYIKKKLIEIHSTVEIDKKFNFQDVNIKAEEIFRRVLNATYSWNLIDANKKIKNFPAIDLIDESKKIVLQVTSSLGTAKINDTLKGFNKFKDDLELKKYADYRLIFCYIVKEKEVRSDKFLKDKNLQNNDFIDINDILEKIDEQTENNVYEVLKSIYVEDKVAKMLELHVDDGVTGVVKNDGTVTQNITHNYYNDEKIVPNKPIEEMKTILLTTIPEINDEFRGRKSDLGRIHERLQKDNLSCVVNGIGGIGKSELSYEYLHQYKNSYDRVAVVKMLEDQKSLEETFFFSFPKFSEVNGEKNFNILMKQLQSYGGKNLLVVDNLQHGDDFKKVKPLSLNFDVIITTRIKLDSNNILNLETLNRSDAKELFLSIYSTNENINDILKYLDNHPLFIKLIAYSLKEEYMELDEVMSSELPEIDSSDDKTFKEHLQRTFNKQFMQQSKDEYKELLKILALFPAIEIDLAILEKIVGGKRLKSKLQKLVHQGWLIKKENSYKLHQIIKTFILTSYPAEYEDVTFVLENIGDYIDPIDSTLIASQLSDYIPIIDSLLGLFEDKQDEYIAKNLDSNTYLYFSLGEYANSLEMQKKSLAFREKLYDEKSVLVAKNYNLLGVIYNSKGEYDKAEQFYEMALEINREIQGESHLDTATSYSNLSELYKLKGEYDKAEPFYKKSLNIFEEILGESHVYTATGYNNLGTFYYSKHEYEKAEFFHKKALEIRKKILEKYHPDIASSYNNLAQLYTLKKEYPKAELFYEKSLKIRENILGENHPDTAKNYTDFGFFYKKRKKCQKAKEYLEKAIGAVEKLEYQHLSLIGLRRALRDVEKSIEKEKKAKFNKKGKYCVDMK
jgi:tetratricopeptide (TPR) repeat protein